ncbi:MAG: hypothetical protein J3T61_10230, partial [Candidatus Brocadiales bacterium]|nr:hypothetical protein [Candidatus Bathyanammoxibius sp.]
MNMKGRFIWNRETAFTDGDTTPSVLDGNFFVTSNTGATTISDFNDGFPGQTVILRINDANTTIADNANFNLWSGANTTYASSDLIMFQFDGTAWQETPHRTTFNINNLSVAGTVSVTGALTSTLKNPLEGTLSNVPRWILKQVDFGDMTAAATADTFTLWALPTNTIIHDVIGRVVTGWSGGSISAAVCSVGTQAGSANDLTLDDSFFTSASTVYELH